MAVYSVFQLIHNIKMTKMTTRDKTAEQIIDNRKALNENWNELTE